MVGAGRCELAERVDGDVGSWSTGAMIERHELVVESEMTSRKPGGDYASTTSISGY